MCFVNNGKAMIYRLVSSIYPSLIVSPEHQSRVYPLGEHLSFILRESAYLHLQATKPDTIGNVEALSRPRRYRSSIVNRFVPVTGNALSESPVALATYILEKFSTWTNPEYSKRDDGGLLEKYTMDELLDNVMVYWVTNSITTSMRLYAESFSYEYTSAKWDE